jgi:hypothetical protein
MTQRDRDYEALRAALAELRAADERSAPAFEAILTSVPSRSRRRLRVGRLAIAAGLVLGVVGLYGMLSARRPRLTVPSEVVALSAWRPATDVLLATPGRSLLTQTPQLGASLIDIRISGDFR